MLLLAIVAGVLAGGAALASVAGRFTLPADWSILACDVGQGDAVLLRSAGAIALVDTGPDPEPLDDVPVACGHRPHRPARAHALRPRSRRRASTRSSGGWAPSCTDRRERLTGARVLTRLARRRCPHSCEAHTGHDRDARRCRRGACCGRGPSTRAYPAGQRRSASCSTSAAAGCRHPCSSEISPPHRRRALAASGDPRPPYDAREGRPSRQRRPGRGGCTSSPIRRSPSSPSAPSNNYGHPRAEILDDLSQQLGARIARTDVQGMIARLARGRRACAVWRERGSEVVRRWVGWANGDERATHPREQGPHRDSADLWRAPQPAPSCWSPDPKRSAPSARSPASATICAPRTRASRSPTCAPTTTRRARCSG